MDVFAFFKMRVDFIKRLYDGSCAPFALIKQQIKEGVPPYDSPSNEVDEPPFLVEWLEADESLQVLGYACVSMLAASLHLLFKTWEKELGVPAHPQYKTIFKKNGWLYGYKQYFLEQFGVDISEAPVDMKILEETVRARNIVQHPQDIASNTVSFTDDDLDVLQEPYLSSEIERRMSRSFSEDGRFLLPLNLHVSPKKFDFVLNNIIDLAAWLDVKIYDVKNNKRGR